MCKLWTFSFFNQNVPSVNNSESYNLSLHVSRVSMICAILLTGLNMSYTKEVKVILLLVSYILSGKFGKYPTGR